MVNFNLAAIAMMGSNIIAATGADFKEFGDVLSSLFDSMFTPLISIAIALTAIWGFYLGFKFWRSSGDENKRKDAKQSLIAFIVGIFVIFLVAVAAPLLITALSTWMQAQ